MEDQAHWIGERVSVRTRGRSMRGRIEDGQRVTLSPCDPRALSRGDVVLVQMKRNVVLHQIVEARGGRFLIGSTIGGINGLADAADVLGVAIAVEGQPMPRARIGKARGDA
jgi:hypothetical protein